MITSPTKLTEPATVTYNTLNYTIHNHGKDRNLTGSCRTRQEARHTLNKFLQPESQDRMRADRKSRRRRNAMQRDNGQVTVCKQERKYLLDMNILEEYLLERAEKFQHINDWNSSFECLYLVTVLNRGWFWDKTGRHHIEIQNSQSSIDALDEVYEKFKHLDKPLSDPEWCESGDGSAIYAIAGELWRAIKRAREQQEKKINPRTPCPRPSELLIKINRICNKCQAKDNCILHDEGREETCDQVIQR